MPKTFDGIDVDIHKLEEPLDVKLAVEKERVTERMKQDLRQAIRSVKPRRKKKSLIVVLASTIIVPGLGSVYLKRTFFGISILSLNLMFMILGFSFFPLFAHSYVFLARPEVYYSSYLYFGSEAPVFAYFPEQFTVLFSWSVLFIAAAWVHLLYMHFKCRGEIEFVS